jgi:hypothetical protein
MFFKRMIHPVVFTAQYKTQWHSSPTRLLNDNTSLCFTTYLHISTYKEHIFVLWYVEEYGTKTLQLRQFVLSIKSCARLNSHYFDLGLCFC